MEKAAQADYAAFCRPGLAKLLSAAGLDVPYHRGVGDRLAFHDERGHEVEVLDFLGGYGASIFGHNHPRLVHVARASLDENRPFNAQASCRSGAARLAARLSAMLEERFGVRFVATFASTGAEAVEAAIKHALLANHDRVTAIRASIEERLSRLAGPIAAGRLELAPGIPEALVPRGEPPDAAAILAAIRETNARALVPSAAFLHLRRSFHGKTLGALQLTSQARYRAGFAAGFGLRTREVEPDDAASLLEAVARETVRYFEPVVAGERLLVEERRLANVCALFIEPIQGEGGIHPLGPAFARACRDVATEHRFPLVVDEIQCGMGRTGTFLFSEQLGIAGDYLLLSKGLGGGLAKVAALLVRKDLSRDDFGVVHTSTFAEDDPGAAVALEGLALLEEGGEACRLAAARGRQLLDGASALLREYPGVLEAVRGAGLLIGVQFRGLEASGSPLLRMVSEQGLLGSLISGWLLHEHSVRVAPTLSSSATIRLEPSVFVSEADCDRVLAALRRLCAVLDRHDSHALLRFLGGAARPAVEPVVDRRRPNRMEPPAAGITRVAFIGHLIRAADLRLVDDGLRPLTDGQLERLVDRVHGVLEFAVQERRCARSVTGANVQLEFIGAPVDSRAIVRGLREGDLEGLRERIRRAATEAEERGCSVVGLGGLASVVMADGRRLAPRRIGVTTGNAFTVAIGFVALLGGIRDRALAGEAARAAVIGASGNIASTYAELLAEVVPRVCLIGRTGSEARLASVATRIYDQAFRAILAAEEAPDGFPASPILPWSVAGRLRETRAFEALRRLGARATCPGRYLLDHLREELVDPPITLATGLDTLRRANLIVAASNSPAPLILPEHLGEGPVVICDIALPQDTHPEVMERRSDVTFIRGGVVRLPLDPDWRIAGIDLPPGECLACMAETLLLGLEGLEGNFSHGPISRAQVRRIAEIGRKHGFLPGGTRGGCTT